mgnify:CR=1 FL=1
MPRLLLPLCQDFRIFCKNTLPALPPHTILIPPGCAAHEKVISTLRKKKQAGDFIGRIEHTSMKMEEQRTFCFLCTFAYLNFQLSDVLLAVIQTCAAVNAELMLVSIRYVFIGNNGCRTHFAFRGMDYDELFHIEPALYICMAAINNYFASSACGVGGTSSSITGS